MSNAARSRNRPRDALVAAALLACAPAAALGLGRFGYALLVPAMHADLHWSYLEAGVLGTANALGYLIGAIIGAGCGRTVGERRALLGSLVVVVVTLFLCAATGSIVLLSALRVAAGVAGGVIYVVGGGIAARLGRESGEAASMAIGIYFAGVGAGILVSGLAVPEAIQASAHDWRRGWLILGAGSAVAFFGLLAGLSKIEDIEGTAAVTATRGSKESLRGLLPLFITYGLEGVGYIAYMTFAVALIRMDGASTLETIVFWSAVGLGAAVSTPVLSPSFASPRLRGGRSVACGVAALAIATALPLASDTFVVFVVSALIFGSSFIAVASAAAFAVRESVPQEQVTATLGSFTIIFAVGQMLGPLLAGSIADTHAGLRIGLLASVVILVVAIPVALLQRPSVPTGR